MKNQYSASVVTFPVAELDDKIPSGALRDKFAPLEIIDENELPLTILEPTWREVIQHCNPNILSSTRKINGQEFICYPDVFSDLSGETAAIYTWGSGLQSPNRTKFTYGEFEAFGWDPEEII